MMFRGLVPLVWLETKIFIREPLGLIASVVVPVLIFVWLGRTFASPEAGSDAFIGVKVPVFGAVLIVLSATVSLVAIIAIYRESGILKRLRATPLRPQTILLAHVVVKLAMTVVTLGLMVLAGRRLFPVTVDAPVAGFAVAVILSTCSILSVGFVIASLVRTARFAQPMASIILYPMIGLSGLFVPLEVLPPVMRTIGHALPLTYAVSLLEGVWIGDPWSAHVGDLVGLVVVFLACTAVSAKVFRWE